MLRIVREEGLAGNQDGLMKYGDSCAEQPWVTVLPCDNASREHDRPNRVRDQITLLRSVAT